MNAQSRWSHDLALWAIPAPLLEQAPESPYGFPVELFAAFAARADSPETPSRMRARQALPEGGAVLDVGCGAGAASLPLVPPASRVTGVDSSPDLLRAFVELATARRIKVTAVDARWPAAASQVEPADVVVCHNVLYDVADIGPFVQALDARAIRRVVIEITVHHPLSWMNPYWRVLHGIARPERPVAGDALDVLRECGFPAHVERWTAPFSLSDADPDLLVRFVRRSLCLPPARDEDIRAALSHIPPPSVREMATIWWDVGR